VKIGRRREEWNGLKMMIKAEVESWGAYWWATWERSYSRHRADDVRKWKCEDIRELFPEGEMGMAGGINSVGNIQSQTKRERGRYM
jgi:hypothetical protein